MPVTRVVRCAHALASALIVASCSPAQEIPDGLARLARAYPEQIERATADMLTLKSGQTIPYESGREGAPFIERLGIASLKDQMSMTYPAGRDYTLPKGDGDPGRLRHIPFFKAMYGANEQQIRAKLVVVRWFDDKELLVTRVNGVDKALARVFAALRNLPPQIRACAEQPAGAFIYRPVTGTDYLSTHSFGIAVDLNLACSDYWYWEQQKNSGNEPAYTNRMPLEIVDIFEREGFIWGGKWAHFDTMHFEYRPELLPVSEKR